MADDAERGPFDWPEPDGAYLTELANRRDREGDPVLRLATEIWASLSEYRKKLRFVRTR